jgi:DNA-binding NarL/FixJ family response regulator
VANASVEPLVVEPLAAESLVVEPPEPEGDAAAAASVVDDASEEVVVGVGSDVVVALGTGSDEGVGSEGGGGALGAGSVVAVAWLVVSTAGAAASVTGCVAVCVVVATASVAVATGSEAVVVFVADPAIAAVPLRSLMASPLPVTETLVPVLHHRLPVTHARSNSGKSPFFFRCDLGENREGHLVRDRSAIHHETSEITRGDQMELGDTVLIADPDEGSRAELASVLSEAGYAVTQTDRGDEALALARSIRPSAVVLEIPLDGLCGYEVCRQLKADASFEAPIIFISSVRTEPYDRIAGLMLEADDYLVSPYLAGELIARLNNLIARTHPQPSSLRLSLTNREQEIIELMGDGLRHGEIAVRLFISPKTVASHVDHILRKLGVRSSREAVSVAYREGIISPQAKAGSETAIRRPR